jgi:hypothetical protein
MTNVNSNISSLVAQPKAVGCCDGVEPPVKISVRSVLLGTKAF